MKVLIINPILYTAETRNIPVVKTIKDTMIYDLCLGFLECGHEITLYAADAYKPIEEEEYPFEVVWGECKLTKVFLPSRLPWMPSIKRYLQENKFDLIISSEVFSPSTYYAYKLAGNKAIAWHEIAKHQAMFHQIPSKIWYNFVAKYLMKNLRVVARSAEAKAFISKYCKKVESEIIDHGVNLKKFTLKEKKNNQFLVCSQLIPRKRIDGIILSFKKFLELGYSDYILNIAGSGESEEELMELAKTLNVCEKVKFLGKLSHEDVVPLLSSAKALLVNTVKDNNMVSIVESIASGTPVITTEVPLNSSYIKAEKLGIAKDNWGASELIEIVDNNELYVRNCLNYRNVLSTQKRVEQFIELYEANEQ